MESSTALVRADQRKAIREEHSYQQHRQHGDFSTLYSSINSRLVAIRLEKSDLHIAIADELRTGRERFFNRQHNARRITAAKTAGLGTQQRRTDWLRSSAGDVGASDPGQLLEELTYDFKK